MEDVLVLLGCARERGSESEGEGEGTSKRGGERAAAQTGAGGGGQGEERKRRCHAYNLLAEHSALCVVILCVRVKFTVLPPLFPSFSSRAQR